jgi:hypothetical protein
MYGQWIGTYEGTNSGTAVVEADDFGDYYDGYVFVSDSKPGLPATFAPFRTTGKSERFDLPIALNTIDPRTGVPTNWDSVRHLYPGVTFPSYADTKWEYDDDDMRVEWETNIKTSGKATLRRSKADGPSEYRPADINTWGQFREHVGKLEHYRYLYRGQEDSRWRLRTYFHRLGSQARRASLVRFLNTDIQTLHQHLSSLTKHVFNLSHPIEHGAFVSLVQHHGYPTPLLDWTYSPFISAYFAFKKMAPDANAQRKVRIFIFDRLQWRNDFPQLPILSPALPHFSMLDALAIENPRMVPQQGVSTISNVDDIESYIRSKEVSGKQYLQVVDLPISERRYVLRELSLMGITAGSLFPGLDGACDQLKDRFFRLPD